MLAGVETVHRGLASRNTALLTQSRRSPRGRNEGRQGDRKDGRCQDFVPSWPAVGLTDSFPVRSCDPRSFLKASNKDTDLTFAAVGFPKC